MSEQSLSANPPKPNRLTPEEMRVCLQKMLRENPEANYIQQLSRGFRDPVKEAQDGRFYLSPIWVQLLALAGLGIATFVYFTFAK